MNTITERRNHETRSLSSNQKFVLAKLISSPSEQTAYEAVSRGANIVGARDQLTKNGLMTMDPTENRAQITDVGKEQMREEGLLDDMDGLTEEGEKWGYANTPEDVEKLAAQNKPPEAPVDQAQEQPEAKGGNMPTGLGGAAEQDGGGLDAFSIESLEMVQSFNTELKEREFLKKNKL